MADISKSGIRRMLGNKNHGTGAGQRAPEVRKGLRRGVPGRMSVASRAHKVGVRSRKSMACSTRAVTPAGRLFGA